MHPTTVCSSSSTGRRLATTQGQAEHVSSVSGEGRRRDAGRDQTVGHHRSPRRCAGLGRCHRVGFTTQLGASWRWPARWSFASRSLRCRSRSGCAGRWHIARPTSLVGRLCRSRFRTRDRGRCIAPHAEPRATVRASLFLTPLEPAVGGGPTTQDDRTMGDTHQTGPRVGLTRFGFAVNG